MDKRADDDQTLSTQECADIAVALAPIAVPLDRAASLKTRVMSGIPRDARPVQISSVTTARAQTIRTSERQWRPFTPGVEICVLFEDEYRRSALLKMGPGSFLFPHHHDAIEESMVLEGSAIDDDELYLSAGDYQWAAPGTKHGIISSPEGCIVWIHGERKPRTAVSLGLVARLAKYFFNSKRPNVD